MFQLRQLRTFVAAAETLSFTRAAGRVHLSQPSVTEQIRALEDTVGRPLFLRQHNTLVLTDAGRQLQARAGELLALADDAFHALKGGAAPEAAGLALTLVAPETLTVTVFAPVVADYAQHRPEVKVSLLARNSADTLAALKNGVADIGLLHGWPLNDAALASEVLTSDEPVVVLPSAHTLGQRSSLSVGDLAGLRLGATAPGCAYRAWLDTLLRGRADLPAISFEAESVRSLVAMVAAGLGACVVPRLAFRSSHPGPGVDAVRLDGAVQGLPVCVATPARDSGSEPAHVSAFLAMLRLRTSLGSSLGTSPGTSAALNQPVPAVDV